MNVAIIGCGYAAEFYGKTLVNYPELTLVGAYDKNEKNLHTFTQHWPGRICTNLNQVLDDPDVEMVLNLTDPRSHYNVTKSCLQAGKHVYSEKPLAMNFETAGELVALAQQRQLYLGAAPCSVLGETCQTIWKSLKDGAIGTVRLVYANFDDGMIAPNLSPWQWRNDLDVAWPAKDEFEVGCTYEHAGYVLTWLAAFFGPALRVTSFASVQIPEKGIEVERMAPDFTVGCIEYADGVVARLTCSVVAPQDKSLTIVGDDGVLFTANVRNDLSPVFIRRVPSKGFDALIERQVKRLRGWLKQPALVNGWHRQRRVPFVRRPPGRFVSVNKPIDFCRGPAEMAEAIRENRPSRLSAKLALHIAELIEALQYPERFGGRKLIESTFDPIQPLAWTS
ncbi:MAG TPA: Gfo/Idh/MocA family oxidoreductase [Pyrinomonadaceae bacterium]|nr:Gfo/Idh/MocA family oxidoreductase [Pyrinomonadaceae bacterium]